MFSRLLPGCIILLACSFAVADEDPIGEKLEKAVLAYEERREEFEAGVEQYLDSRETVARRKGDKTVIDQVAAERAGFVTFGKPPVGLPKNLGLRLSAARRSLESAYTLAIRDYTKEGQDEKATEVQYRYEDFQHENGVNLLEGGRLAQWRPDGKGDAFQHWKLDDGILQFDGKGFEEMNLATKADFRDYRLRCEWRIRDGGDSGIHPRGISQIQIWDHLRGPGQGIGSGGLWNNKVGLRHALVVADNPIGEWNAMSYTIIGDKVTVRLNGKIVTDQVAIESYYGADKPYPTQGPIVLQALGTPVAFRNITVVELKAEPE